MATQTITTDQYKLYPSPRNQYREIFEHQVFVPYPYAIIDLEVMELAGKNHPVRCLPPVGHENGPGGDL